jgi:hypothetical protein
MIFREIYSFFNFQLLKIQFKIWRRTHTMQDLEKNLIAYGCTPTRTRNSVIYTTPHHGKIEINDKEIIINP